MDARDLVNLTSEITLKMFGNDPMPFLEHVDEHVLWYGPSKGQFISGRQAVIDSWASEENPLEFTLGNIQMNYASTHKSYCEVIETFPVTVHYPSGENISLRERVHITWCERGVDGQKVPRMLVVQVSNLHQWNETDNIYPVRFNETFKDEKVDIDAELRIHFRAPNSTDYYLLPSTILWAESVDDGRHCILHTADGPVKVNPSITAIEKSYPDFLLRCHKCHLVNPRHVASVRRFKVAMSDGTELPIPEKKYTAFKKAVEARHKS